MTWVRIDEAFARHPKIVQAGPLALAMHVAALCYSNQYLTDGFVPRAAAKTLLDLDGIAVDFTYGDYETGESDNGTLVSWEYVIGKLVGVGLWDETAGGWLIHDYHDFQPSKAQVLEERAKKQAAGKAGGEASARARAKRPAKQTLNDSATNGQAESNPVPVSGPLGTTPKSPQSGDSNGASAKPSPRQLGIAPRQIGARQEYVEVLATIATCPDCSDKSYTCTRCDGLRRAAEAELRKYEVPLGLWGVPVEVTA